MDNIHIEDCSKLELHIHIIGHYPKGESILVILWDGNDNSVLQSILIDSYQTKKGNIAYDLLKEYSIDKNKLNYFVWTHPDLDHSTGIPTIIDNFANKNTRYIVPVGLTSKVFKKVTLYDNTLKRYYHNNLFVYCLTFDLNICYICRDFVNYNNYR